MVAAVELTIDVSELNKLVADLRTAADAVKPSDARMVLQKVAADVKRDGQAFAPVDTGFLRSSITYETHELAGGARAEIGPEAEYGAFVEFGTSRMPGQAFMGPSFDRNAWQVEAGLDALARRALRAGGL